MRGSTAQETQATAAERQSDTEMVERCREGDESAFRCLVDRYYKKVFAIAYGMVRSAEDALDLTQEAFLKVHRSLERFHGTSSFYTWLYRIVVNLCIDHMRKEGRHHLLDYDDTLSHGDGDGAADSPIAMGRLASCPERALYGTELKEELVSAVGRLTEKHRAVLLLREIEGLSYEEISQVMECSKGTVMSRLHHARMKVRKMLRPYLDGKSRKQNGG